MASIIITIYTVLFYQFLCNFKVERVHDAGDNQFLVQNVQNKIFEIFKNVQKQYEINSKVSNRESSTKFMIFLCYYKCWTLLCSLELLIVFNALELHILKSFKVNCYKYSLFFIQATYFSINNCNMNTNNVEKYYFVVLNVKLHAKVRFKTFC